MPNLSFRNAEAEISTSQWPDALWLWPLNTRPSTLERVPGNAQEHEGAPRWMTTSR